MFLGGLLDGRTYDYYDNKTAPEQAVIPKIEEAQTDTDFKRIEARHSQWATIFGAITAIATIYALTRGK